MGKLTDTVFNESCCEGGTTSIGTKSIMPCGCDPGANWVCAFHKARGISHTEQLIPSDIEFFNDFQAGLQVPKSLDHFIIKDSGKRTEFSSGMVRDVTEDKIDYSLAIDGPMFKRLAIHLTKGAKKYVKRNWMKAEGQEEFDRFKESALRHFLQWYWETGDEDHAAATFFNINGAEYVRLKMKKATD